MDDTKEKMLFILAIVLAIIICVLQYYFLVNNENIYYTQINDVKITNLNNNLKYEYKLVCYNKYGKKKEIKFNTDRKLKSDIFYKLEIIDSSDIKNIEEVQYNDVPKNIREKF